MKKCTWCTCVFHNFRSVPFVTIDIQRRAGRTVSDHPVKRPPLLSYINQNLKCKQF
jgi:hypothetical protein